MRPHESTRQVEQINCNLLVQPHIGLEQLTIFVHKVIYYLIGFWSQQLISSVRFEIKSLFQLVDYCLDNKELRVFV